MHTKIQLHPLKLGKILNLPLRIRIIEDAIYFSKLFSFTKKTILNHVLSNLVAIKFY
jgi:hypothetical protein